jgi:hypothetical protein
MVRLPHLSPPAAPLGVVVPTAPQNEQGFEKRNHDNVEHMNTL